MNERGRVEGSWVLLLLRNFDNGGRLLVTGLTEVSGAEAKPNGDLAAEAALEFAGLQR